MHAYAIATKYVTCLHRVYKQGYFGRISNVFLEMHVCTKPYTVCNSRYRKKQIFMYTNKYMYKWPSASS